jgi:hypothetical protein
MTRDDVVHPEAGFRGTGAAPGNPNAPEASYAKIGHSQASLCIRVPALALQMP